MRGKIKGNKNEGLTYMLISRHQRKMQNQSVDISESGKILKKFKLKQTHMFPLLINIDQGFSSHLLRSLKESLTVKKIEFSPAKPNLNTSNTSSRNKPNKPLLLEKVKSFKSLVNARAKAQSVMEKYHPQKLRKIEKLAEIEKASKPESASVTPARFDSIRKEVTPRNPYYPPSLIKVVKPLPKMSFREAIRNAAWVTKVRPELDKLWRKIITRSNGIEPQFCQGSYKYFVGKGNNSRLVARIMASRSWWVETDSIDEANFVWTQWKDKEFIQKMSTHKGNGTNVLSTTNVALISPISIQLEKNQYRTVDIEDLGFDVIRNSPSYTFMETCEVTQSESVLYNKLEFNQHLANKKGLFKSLKNYYEAVGKDLFECIPMTFHVKGGESDPEFGKVVQEFENIEREKAKLKMQNLWIVKPGENSNRGQGISIANSVNGIKDLIANTNESSSAEKRTFIIQKYIEKPFLLHKRKFDIRCYAMITSINGIIQGYSYSDGYLRTTSTEYNTRDIFNNLIHLTNDAIQKHSEEYGKFEDGNKLSYRDFQRYLDYKFSEKKKNFVNDIVPLMKSLIKDTIFSVFLKIDLKKRKNCMEIFGYDFMLDHNLKPWLIEVNTNPCLELASNYLAVLIPNMVENAVRIAVDPLFPPPAGKHTFESFLENKFELIFHQETDGKQLLEDLGTNKHFLMDIEEISDKDEIFSDEEGKL